MKKQIKRLGLNKRTIANLQSSEMKKLRGGNLNDIRPTKNGNTCFGHLTCVTCGKGCL